MLALGAIGLAGGMLAADSGHHPLWRLLLAGFFGFFIGAGCDLTEPVAAACLLGGVLAYRRGRPALAGLLLAYGALSRETVLIVPLAIGLTRLIAAARARPTAPPLQDRRGARPAVAVCRRARPAADLAWCLPLLVYGTWQLVLRAATGRFILLAGFGGNSSHGLLFGEFAAAVRLNLGLLTVLTGAACLWCLEVAVLLAFVAAALASLRSAAVPGYERIASFSCASLGRGDVVATPQLAHRILPVRRSSAPSNQCSHHAHWLAGGAGARDQARELLIR